MLKGAILSGIVITITSGKGGVGKSTTTANLAVGLANSGKKVVAVDFDIGLRNLDMILGLENRIVYDIVNVMEGECNLSQALINDKKAKNLYFLPASQSKDKNILDKEKGARVIIKLPLPGRRVAGKYIAPRRRGRAVQSHEMNLKIGRKA